MSHVVNLRTGPWRKRLHNLAKAERWGVLLSRALVLLVRAKHCTCEATPHRDNCLLLLATELEVEANEAGIKPMSLDYE